MNIIDKETERLDIYFSKTFFIVSYEILFDRDTYEYDAAAVYVPKETAIEEFKSTSGSEYMFEEEDGKGYVIFKIIDKNNFIMNLRSRNISFSERNINFNFDIIKDLAYQQ